MASPKGKRSSSRSRSTKLRSSRSKSRSKSRSRSRSRGRSATRLRKSATPSRSEPKPTPTRSEKKPSTPTRSSMKQRTERADTPTRKSARLLNMTKPPEERKTLDFPDSGEKKGAIPKTTHREFGGVLGTLFLMISLPLTTVALNKMCSEKKCKPHIPQFSKNWKDYLNLEATLIFLGWFVFQAVLYLLPIGQVVEGQTLRGGGKLKYKCNGFWALLISLAAFGAAVYFKLPIDIVHKKFQQLIVSGTIFSFVMSLFLYIKARRGPKSKLAPGGNTGNVIYDYFMGHELNPRIGNFDLKFFCELRPGLIGWVMINLVFLTEEFNRTGQFPPALTMVTAFQALYVADALWFEDAILTTMDIIQDGFGFMLVFGDLVWVPFLYTLQTRFLAENHFTLPWFCNVGIVILNLVGYFIFRGSNSQKNEFRKNPYNPSLAHLETIPTASGKRLLASGWWGMCRKPNYLGDIIMATAWSMACGSSTPLPYFYPVYFTILLIHRQLRDEEHCAKKYKASWDRYCERVRYRIFPLVY